MTDLGIRGMGNFLGNSDYGNLNVAQLLQKEKPTFSTDKNLGKIIERLVLSDT